MFIIGDSQLTRLNESEKGYFKSSVGQTKSSWIIM